jgi:hypothetical protein
MTYNRQNVNFYVDGEYVGVGAETGAIGTNNDDVYLCGDSADMYPFSGLIDEIKI